MAGTLSFGYLRKSSSVAFVRERWKKMAGEAFQRLPRPSDPTPCWRRTRHAATYHEDALDPQRRGALGAKEAPDSGLNLSGVFAEISRAGVHRRDRRGHGSHGAGPPVPKRYLDEDQAFKSFQWIEGRFQPNLDDGRPESLRVDFTSIEPGDEIPAKDQDARRLLIERSPSLVRSQEELKDLQARCGMSLGAIVPKSIDDIKLRRRNAAEREEWLAVEKRLLSQETLRFVRPPKKLDFPETEFVISYTCNDSRCNGHRSGLKSWPAHEGYRKMKGDPDRDKKMLAMLEREFDLRTRDVFLFLGSFHNHRTTFGLMDAYRPKRRDQLDLFP